MGVFNWGVKKKHVRYATMKQRPPGVSQDSRPDPFTSGNVPYYGRRKDLQGGGLIRSAGGDRAGLLGQKKEDQERGDARILGSGDFACPVKCFCLSI